MKSLILIVTAVLVLVLGIVGCEPIERTERPDLPDYTADQVIAVAQAQYPSYGTYSGITINPSISVEYVGESIWRVNIDFPSGYRVGGHYIYGLRTKYFNETTGVLD